MKSLNYLIVKAKDSYNNSIGGVSRNTSIETVSSINREVEVESAPDNVIITKGDKVIIHHNILRLRNNLKGNLVNSNYYLKVEGDFTYYVVPLTEIFMYKKPNGAWTSLEPYCFIKPILSKESKTVLLGEEDSFDHKGHLKHYGILKYSNKELDSLGLKVGDTIIFSTWGEYEFEIEGEIVYKMSTKDILVKL